MVLSSLSKLTFTINQIAELYGRNEVRTINSFVTDDGFVRQIACIMVHNFGILVYVCVCVYISSNRTGIMTFSNSIVSSYLCILVDAIIYQNLDSELIDDQIWESDGTIVRYPYLGYVVNVHNGVVHVCCVHWEIEFYCIVLNQVWWLNFECGCTHIDLLCCFDSHN